MFQDINHFFNSLHGVKFNVKASPAFPIYDLGKLYCFPSPQRGLHPRLEGLAVMAE